MFFYNIFLILHLRIGSIAMYKIPLIIGFCTFGLIACVSNQYPPVGTDHFQKKINKNSKEISIIRDSRLCAGDTTDKQNCPIDFYIDSIKSGSFYINDEKNYYLKSENYNFKVKNCTEDSCQSCDIDIPVSNFQDNQFLLSVDDSGKPFISNNGSPLICNEKVKEIKVSKESTVTLDLAADTLFKFNGSSLNDLLPKGRQEIVNVASHISNNFISVNRIKLTGHTDRLGSDSYNQQLGQNRAATVRNLLIQNGVNENAISVVSAGKQQPITNGCFDIKQREELEKCLQPDRRVSVEITGITK